MSLFGEGGVKFSPLPSAEQNVQKLQFPPPIISSCSLLSFFLHGVQTVIIAVLLFDRYYDLQPCIIRKCTSMPEFLKPAADLTPIRHSAQKSTVSTTLLPTQNIAALPQETKSIPSLSNSLSSTTTSQQPIPSPSKSITSDEGLFTEICKSCYCIDAIDWLKKETVKWCATTCGEQGYRYFEHATDGDQNCACCKDSETDEDSEFGIHVYSISDDLIQEFLQKLNSRPRLKEMPADGPAIWFATFADGHTEYRTRLVNFAMQARQCHWFHRVKPCWDDCIDQEFREEHQTILDDGRGHGLWFWKPYIILQTLQEMRENDILVYADAGCTIQCNEKAEPLFRSYVKKVTESEYGLLAFATSKPEFWYNKQDLRLFLNVSDDDWHSAQVMATALYVRKCEHSIKFLEEWIRIGGSQDGHFIDNSPSNATNEEGFRATRHDQSVFSILIKQLGGLIEGDTVDKRADTYPIQGTRIRKCRQPHFNDFEC